MRILVTFVVCLLLSIIGFSLSLAATPQVMESQMDNALDRADNARHAFVEAYNNWANRHDKFTTSIADKERFRKVRKAWKEFDQLAREVEY